MKKCPFCAEEIQDEAIVCKHCGRALAPEKVTRVSEDLASQDKTSKALEAFAKTEDGNGEAPVWKKAIRWGGIFAIVFAIYILSQYSQGRVSSDRVVLDLLFGIVIWFVLGAISGFVLITLWRWNKWALFVICALAIVGLLVSPLGGINVIIPGFVNRISIPPTLTAIPATSTTTSTPLPTRRPSASPTIRINPLVAKGCVHWSKVTHADVGKELCVFGIVRHVSDLCLDPEGTDFYCFNWAQTWFAHFSNEISSESSHFRLYSINASYPGINVRDCISLEGIVRSNGSNSFVFINPASPSVGGEVLIYSDGSVCIP